MNLNFNFPGMKNFDFPGMENFGDALKGSEWDLGLEEIGAGAIESGAIGGIVYKGGEILDELNDLAKGKEEVVLKTKDGWSGEFDLSNAMGGLGPIIYPIPIGPGDVDTTGKGKQPPDLPVGPGTTTGGATKRPAGGGGGGSGETGGPSSGGGELVPVSRDDNKTKTGSPDGQPDTTGTQTDEKKDDRTKEEEDEDDPQNPIPKTDKNRAETSGSSTRKNEKTVKSLSILEILKKMPKNEIRTTDLHNPSEWEESQKADAIIAEEVTNESRQKQKTSQVDDYFKYHAGWYLINSELELEKLYNKKQSIFEFAPIIDPTTVFSEVQKPEYQQFEDQYDLALRPTFQKELYT